MSAMRWRRVLLVGQASGHRMFWVPHSGSDILAEGKATIQWLGRRMMYFRGDNDLRRLKRDGSRGNYRGEGGAPSRKQRGMGGILVEWRGRERFV